MVMKNSSDKGPLSNTAQKKCRCSVCGEVLTTPQNILRMKDKRYCNRCYQDSFFANTGCRRRMRMERCDG